MESRALCRSIYGDIRGKFGLREICEEVCINPKVKLNLQPGKTEVQITVVDAKKRNISSLSNTTIVDLAKIYF